MGLDIRIPMGVMFVILGVIIAGFGLVSDPKIYERSLGININLWWGLVMMIFGGCMLALAWRAATRTSAKASLTEPTDTNRH